MTSQIYLQTQSFLQECQLFLHCLLPALVSLFIAGEASDWFLVLADIFSMPWYSTVPTSDLSSFLCWILVMPIFLLLCAVWHDTVYSWTGLLEHSFFWVHLVSSCQTAAYLVLEHPDHSGQVKCTASVCPVITYDPESTSPDLNSNNSSLLCR